MSQEDEDRDLRELARLYGVQPAYYDVEQRLCAASPDSLLRVLQILGAPLESMADLPDALAGRRRALASEVLERVAVAWNGVGDFRVRLPSAENSREFRCRLMFEDGGTQEWTGSFAELPTLRRRTVEGEKYEVKCLTLPTPLPLGYHRLTLEYGNRSAEAFVISAPEKAYRFEKATPGSERSTDNRGRSPGERLWGVFIPLYALHRESSWGGGDFSDLEALMNWTAEQGGHLVATLPLLASLFDLTGDPSPYSPATRLFWNEFYLDVTQIPEFSTCREAREFLQSAKTRSELQALRKERYVDYPRQMALKRHVLMILSEAFHTGDAAERQADFERFCREHSQAETYARFRAAAERHGPVWSDWPEPLRGGTLAAGDYDETVAQYHLYAQWQIERQLRALTEHARDKGLLWYLDFPLGVSGNGYDTWRQRDVFALGAAGGAPPDSYFTKGQNWGFPPLHPRQIREQEYRYLITAIRRHLRYARVLRFDHVMGLHRLFWVPHGLPAKDGVYVRYAAEEQFAILTLESHRHQAEIVGENLGTVPEKINRMMERHGIHTMYVVQYAAKPQEAAALPPAASTEVASLNTHDMPPFAAFWRGLDIDDRFELGLLTAERAEEDRAARARLRRAVAAFLRHSGHLPKNRRSPEAVLEACLSFLSSSPAAVVLVNLEDLWGETHSQNTPGTWNERPNWKYKARHRFEKFCDLPAVLRLLRTVDEARRGGGDRRLRGDQATAAAVDRGGMVGP